MACRSSKSLFAVHESGSGPIATFPCAANSGRHRGIADMAGLVAGSTRSRMTQCMVRPRVARGFVNLADAVLHQCIRPLIGARGAPGHHGYQRACDLITGQASTGAIWVTGVRMRRSSYPLADERQVIADCDGRRNSLSD
jgi:hypothetical protein